MEDERVFTMTGTPPRNAKPGRPLKRSVMIAGHATSVSLEPEFWDALREIAAARGQTLNELITAIDAARAGRGLSSAVRVFVLDYLRNPSSRSVETPDSDEGSR